VSVAELQVVFVCTGNRFRSPLAAELFRARTSELPVIVFSAGTMDVGAAPALPEALEQALLLGADLSSHRSRWLINKDLSAIDLVVGFEHAHVAAAVVRAKAPAERTFTLPQLVELLELAPVGWDSRDPVERARGAIARADALRRESGAPAGVHEIADPLGAPAEVSHRTALTISSLTSRLADGLFGPRTAL
jgi:protein-tyrosine phosphatase